MITYTLDNGEERAHDTPKTFQIPPRSQREAIKPGDIVKLIFHIETESEVFVERMWVIVKERKPELRFSGTLDNDPTCATEMTSGLEVEFGPEHVISIWSGTSKSASKPWWKFWK